LFEVYGPYLKVHLAHAAAGCPLVADERVRRFGVGAAVDYIEPDLSVHA
jgi:hypothetical protein